MEKITNKWRKVDLGSLAEFRNGLNYNKSNFGTGIKVINVKDFKDNFSIMYDELDEINPKGIVKDENFLKDGDILFVRSNGNRELIGRSLFITGLTEKVTHSAFTIRARFINNEVIPRFYAYLLRSSYIRQTLTAQGNGTNISNLNQAILSNLEVPFPSAVIQRKIVMLLSTYDNAIENNERRIGILEEMAQMLYREWFVKFKFPGYKNVKIVKSEIGLIPEGWDVRTLSDICSINMGQSPESKYYNNERIGLPFHQGVSNFNRRYPTHEVYCSIEKRIANQGDILLSVRAPVGRINIADRNLVIGRGIAAIRHSNGLQSFIYYLLKNVFKEEDTIGNGAIFNSVTKDDINNIKVIVPNNEIDVEYNRLAENIDSLISTLIVKNQNLINTRDLLLPKLISGELDVENLDIDTGGDEN